MVKTGSTFRRAYIVLEDYDDVHQSIVEKRDIFNLMQLVIADGAFGPTKCNPFRVIFVKGEGRSYWFTQTPLHYM